MPAHVRKGDSVMVTSGDDKGRVGEILRVDPKNSQVVVKGVNLQTKHLKPTQQAPQGGVIQREAPIHMSKVSPVVDGKAVRVGFRTEADGRKVRVARHSGKDGKVLGVVSPARGGEGAPKPAAKPTKAAKPAKAAKPEAKEPKTTKAATKTKKAAK